MPSNPNFPQGLFREPIVDPQTGLLTSTWSRLLQQIILNVALGLNVNGIFTSNDGHTITVTNGIVTKIV